MLISGETPQGVRVIAGAAAPGGENRNEPYWAEGKSSQGSQLMAGCAFITYVWEDLGLGK